MTRSFHRFVLTGLAFAAVSLVGPSCQVTDPHGRVVSVRTAGLESDSYGTVDGQEVRFQELDNTTRRRIFRLRQDYYLAKKAAFEGESAHLVLEKVAEKRGLTVDELLKHDVDEPSRQQAEADAKAFVQKNENDLTAVIAAEFPDLAANHPKAPEAIRKVVFDSLKKRLQEKAREDYIQALVAKSDVRFLVVEPEPLRQTIAVSQNPSLGPVSAPIQVIEFGAYGDPLTAKMEEQLHALMKDKPGKIEWTFLEAPRKNSSELVKRVHRLSACANHLGKFWDLHEVFIAHAATLGDKNLAGYLKAAGILEAQMRLCMDQEIANEALARDRLSAEDVALEDSPAFFVNGIEVRGIEGPAELARIVTNEEKANYFLAVEKIK